MGNAAALDLLFWVQRDSCLTRRMGTGGHYPVGKRWLLNKFPLQARGK